MIDEVKCVTLHEKESKYSDWLPKSLQKDAGSEFKARLARKEKLPPTAVI